MATRGRLILSGGRLLDPEAGLDEPGSVVIEDGRVAAIVRAGDGTLDRQPNDDLRELNGAWITPGLVDLRASLREPGFEHKETIATGLRAAAAGGFVAVCAMPDTLPVLDGEAAVRQVLTTAAAQTPGFDGRGGARVLPVGAATKGLDGDHLAPMGELAEAGCVAITQGERPISSARLMRRVLEYASIFDLPVMSSAIEPTLRGLCDEGPWSTRLGLSSNPAAAEVIAVARDLALAELTGGRLHLNRLSCRGAVELVARAKERGVPVTCDVTAHHLTLTSAALVDYDPNMLVWPPLRSEDDREALREGLASGIIDAVASDHQPHHIEDKTRELCEAAVGISGLETVLPLLLALVRAGALSERRLVDALAGGPRRALGIAGARSGLGGLAVGASADLTVIAPEASWIPDAASLLSMGKNSPFIGQVMTGRAALTLVGGAVVWRDAEVTG